MLLRRGLYYKFVEKTAIWMTISAICIIVGFAGGYFNPRTPGKYFNLGIDYTGGEKIILQGHAGVPGRRPSRSSRSWKSTPKAMRRCRWT